MGPADLFPFFRHAPLTGLQRYAAEVELAAGPQLFLLEDVTGSGKTEAALLLAHRLMSAGHAAGLYFGLPTMATANQLYTRVSAVYARLYGPETAPSLVLSHGANRLVDGFRDSIVYPESLAACDAGATEPPLPSRAEPLPGSAQCAAWLADRNKKSLLADVGVGTVDQALGVLPVRHQSLRLLGLAHKVLVVDEVHAYDSYTGRLLETLVEAQALAGGSTILLSATLPASLRAKLIAAHRLGLGLRRATADEDRRYPLATQVLPDGQVKTAGLETRPDLLRTVAVCTCASYEEATAFVLRSAAAGRAVCWIRNTVDDALEAHAALAAALGVEAADRLTLFHARFAMGDRLAIEARVLERFGKGSTAAQRTGQVLIATQVVEQSLDLDFDELVTDLCPVDLVIQRAGRLHRHVRTAAGDPIGFSNENNENNAANESDENELRRKASGRGAPTLHLLAPERADAPGPGWYATLFPRAEYVYPHTGRLWLTLEALLAAGHIVSPGAIGEPGSVRALIEAVYGDDVAVPEGLQTKSSKAEGEQSAQGSLGKSNSLRLDLGYGGDPDANWASNIDTPTRLGEETETVYLAREQQGRLVPYAAEAGRVLYAAHGQLAPTAAEAGQTPNAARGRFDWELSAVSRRASPTLALSAAWQARFGTMLDEVRSRVRLLSEPEVKILPLTPDGDGWTADVTLNGKPAQVRYTATSGFQAEVVDAA